MHGDAINDIVFILLIGVGAQWLAWRLKLPSILLLLASGLLAGPVFGILDPDHLMGDLLVPIVTVSVGIILYEGGLSLRFADLPRMGAVVGNLVTVGALVTWAGATAVAHLLIGISLPLSLLLGAILTVTGPTVVGPLLRAVRPKGEVGSVVRWEGILIDPVGAALSVLVFEQLVSGGLDSGLGGPTMGLIMTILAGTAAGAGGAAILYLLMRYELVPDFLENAVSLGLVLAALFAANLLQPESGLLAVTLMGVLLANQKKVPTHRIVEFKENLRLLLISTLFILLSARISRADLLSLTWMDGLFVALLILVVRPLSVWVSTLRSGLTWREKLFVAWMAPRGIVAAAVASLFAFPLMEAGVEGAERLVPLVFLVIVSTVVVYGLTATPLARALKISEADPQGLLIIGAHGWARAMAKQVQSLGVRVLLVDRNPQNVRRAHRLDLEAHEGDILTENLAEDLNLDGIGHMIALTGNDEVNTLSCVRFAPVFGDRRVYQLVPAPNEANARSASTTRRHGFHGRWVFFDTCTFDSIAETYALGGRFETGKPLTSGSTDRALPENGHVLRPFAVFRPNGRLTPVTCDDPPTFKPGETLLSLRHPAPDNKSVADSTPSA